MLYSFPLESDKLSALFAGLRQYLLICDIESSALSLFIEDKYELCKQLVSIELNKHRVSSVEIGGYRMSESTIYSSKDF